MKNVKTFESFFKKKYELGDYVIFKAYKKNVLLKGKIISTFSRGDQFLIRTIEFGENPELELWTISSKIKRKLNAKEMEEVKFVEDSKKYNL